MDEPQLSALTRRRFLTVFTSVSGGLWLLPVSVHVIGARTETRSEKDVTIVEFSDAGDRPRRVRVPKIVKTDGEWRQLLTPEAFEVTRHASTERPFTGRYWNLHERGVYRCVCCETALFASATKYDSGTGWPSFWDSLAKENVETADDRSFGMVRTAASCHRCDAHLGHVFDDGPKPTGLRYCMNSAALRFIGRIS